MRVAHPGDFLGDETGCRVPIDRDEGFGGAQGAAGAIAVEPSLADIGSVDAHATMHRLGRSVDDRRGIGVIRERTHGLDAAVLHFGGEGAPVGHVWDQIEHPIRMLQRTSLGKGGRRGKVAGVLAHARRPRLLADARALTAPPPSPPHCLTVIAGLDPATRASTAGGGLTGQARQ